MEKPCSSTSSTPESPLKPSQNWVGADLKTKGPLSEHDQQLERQAVRMLDYTIIPVVTLFYLTSFIDRTNIGNARVAGLQKDLHMTDEQYQTCITIFFGPYIASELAGSLLFRKIGPRLFFAMVVTAWGIVATCQGFVTTYGGLVSVRVLLGLVEGPLFPGITLLLSSFYTRKELAFRIALFSSTASLSGAFSGLLSAAIENMNGVGGRPGWAWIFILEGLFTILVGITGFFFVPSTPRDANFLTEYQKELIIRRLEMDRPFITSAVKFSFKDVLRSVCSPHVIVVSTMVFMTGMMAYGLAIFLPSIVSQLGFSPSASQLLSVGPFVAGFIVSLTSAYFSDRYNSRGITIIVISTLAVAGFALFLSAEHKFTSYGALFLMAAGVLGATPILSAWLANNSEPHYRRATSVAIFVLAVNIGGILSTWSFPTKDGPKFRRTTIINLAFCIFVIVGCFINRAYLSWRNNVKERPGVRSKLLINYVAADKENADGGWSAWSELGDQHPDFVYTL